MRYHKLILIILVMALAGCAPANLFIITPDGNYEIHCDRGTVVKFQKGDLLIEADHTGGKSTLSSAAEVVTGLLTLKALD